MTWLQFVVRHLTIACFLAVIACAGGRSPGADRGQIGVASTTYEVYALRYGTLAQFPVASLVTGADPARRMDIALMVWLIRAPNSDRTVLMDAGFYREKFMSRWNPVDYERPAAALGRLGILPEQVTDIIVSHVHWDHLDGADLPSCTHLDPARGIRAPH